MEAIVCPVCHAVFHVKPYRLKAGAFPCCSRRCTGIQQAPHKIGKTQQRNKAGELNPNWRGGKIQVTCDACGTPLNRKPYQVSRSVHQFCNAVCRGAWGTKHLVGPNNKKWQGGAPEETCEWCKQVYRRFRGKRDDKYGAHFCSHKCQSAWQEGKRTGAESPVWRGGNVGYYGPNWHAQKRAARKRDGYKCQHCGKHQKKCRRALDVHHIQTFRSFGYIPDENDSYIRANDLTNLITLCPQCHKKAEFAKIAIQPYLL